MTSSSESLDVRRISDGNRSSVEQSSSSWTLPNNAVAQSDLDVALQAIEEVFQRSLSISSNDTHHHFIQDTQASLMKHLLRIVNPIPDNDFQDYVDLYHIVPDDGQEGFEEEEEEEKGKGNSEVESDHSMIDDDDEELDEADLVDLSSLHEAKQKREKVRALSKNIQETREKVLQGSLEEVMRKEHAAILEALERRPDLASLESDEEARTQQAALTESLESLSKLLKDSQWEKLPQQLESLQNTIDVIQKESDKDRPLSQTEAAIISRSNSTDEEDDFEELLGDGNDAQVTTAVDRLARFFELVE